MGIPATPERHNQIHPEDPKKVEEICDMVLAPQKIQRIKTKKHCIYTGVFKRILS
jgi:hypothetical protein